ncbi:MAG: hypothetical protein RR340_06765 [Cloacibacillus sp.]
MNTKVKIACGAGAAAVILIAAVLTWCFWSSSGVLSAIPKPDDTKPYLVIETKEYSYPKPVSAMLTDGIYALLKEGTPRNALLAAASYAKEVGMLVQNGSDETTEVFCSFRFPDAETSKLKKGELPKSLAAVFRGARVRRENDSKIMAIESGSMSSPVYYAVAGKNVLMAAELGVLERMIAVGKNSSDGLGGKKWSDERSWPGHIEISDGGAATVNSQYKFPITVEAAWRDTDKKNAGDPAGEVRWRLVKLPSLVESYLKSNMKVKKWDTANSIIPEPLLLSMGIVLPPLDGAPQDWPFPFSSLGEIAENLEMNDAEIREILSGETILSLGGQNRILWFSLPGFLVELSGKPDLMNRLISSFWKNLFFGAEPKPLAGFTAGGATNLPFSVIGAGRDNIAVFGLTTPSSLNMKDGLGRFLKDDEAVVGWMLADLPRIGGALSEMTKMSSFLNDEDSEDAGIADGAEGTYDENYPEQPEADAEQPEPIQPEMKLTPFDQGITDSFGSVLKKMGRVLIVWEEPLSGRINWYKSSK